MSKKWPILTDRSKLLLAAYITQVKRRAMITGFLMGTTFTSMVAAVLWYFLG